MGIKRLCCANIPNFLSKGKKNTNKQTQKPSTFVIFFLLLILFDRTPEGKIWYYLNSEAVTRYLL